MPLHRFSTDLSRELFTEGQVLAEQHDFCIQGASVAPADAECALEEPVCLHGLLAEQHDLPGGGLTSAPAREP